MRVPENLLYILLTHPIEMRSKEAAITRNNFEQEQPSASCTIATNRSDIITNSNIMTSLNVLVYMYFRRNIFQICNTF
jgi:hypothetical protein